MKSLKEVKNSQMQVSIYYLNMFSLTPERPGRDGQRIMPSVEAESQEGGCRGDLDAEEEDTASGRGRGETEETVKRTIKRFNAKVQLFTKTQCSHNSSFCCCCCFFLEQDSNAAVQCLSTDSRQTEVTIVLRANASAYSTKLVSILPFF